MTDHDVLLVDLDGTVYRGPDAVDGAVDALEAARGRGVAVGYVTNNASRGPDDVAEHLAGLGLTLTAADVVTSAQAGAALVAERCGPGSPVLVVGTEALADEVRHVGLTPVRAADDDPVAVVQGHSPRTGWAELAEAALALGRGATWVACNVDVTLPSERGLLPGNGAMVAALQAATGLDPQVAGKPAAPLLRQAVERYGATAPLIVGDRLDTDIAGAHTIEAESLLVLTGVSTPADLLAAAPDRRPTYVAAGLDALADLDAARFPMFDAADGWSVRADDEEALDLYGSGADATAALRALCAAAWRTGITAVRASGPDADAAITELGLDAR